MHEAEISKQLESDYNSFLYGKYDGKLPAPENIIDIFKTAVLSMPSFAHKIMFSKIKAIASKEVENLTIGDLNEIIKVVLNIAPERLYPYFEFDQIIEEGIYMDKFVISFNTYVEDFKQKLGQKKARLEALTGNGINGSRNKLSIS